MLIDPESSPDSHINLQGAVKGSIVGIVCVSPSLVGSNGPLESSPSAASHTSAPVFLLLVDDNRGLLSASHSSNPGAYAAHLVNIKHGAFNKLPVAPPPDRVGSHTTAASDVKESTPSHPHGQRLRVTCRQTTCRSNVRHHDMSRHVATCHRHVE